MGVDPRAHTRGGAARFYAPLAACGSTWRALTPLDDGLCHKHGKTTTWLQRSWKYIIAWWCWRTQNKMGLATMLGPSQRHPQQRLAPRQTHLELLQRASCSEEEDELTCFPAVGLYLSHSGAALPKTSG
ncbi:hypothetical protein ABBQ38_011353 [Trebouxia sp. C0009 RCD-2024]